MTTALAALLVGSVAALILCIVRGIMDLQARRLGWGATQLVIAGLLVWGMTTPIQTHAVKIDLPATN